MWIRFSPNLAKISRFWYGEKKTRFNLYLYMEILQAVILGVVQGLTEFLPISSSGHLVLMRRVFGFPDQGLGFDIFLHLATLLAVILYFWRDWIRILKDLFQKKGIFWQIVIATLPAAAAGVFLEKLVENFFRQAIWVALFFVLCGLFFVFAERSYQKIKTKKSLEKISFKDALFIGVAQIFALLPGISRSGSTIAAGMLRGLDREEAAKFSFLMATIIIAGSGSFGIFEAIKKGSLNGFTDQMIFGFASAAIVGYLAIGFLMKFLKKHRLFGFAVYLFLTAAGLLAWQIFSS